MTPSEARLPAPPSPHKRRTPCCAIEAYRYLETHEDGYSPGWRLCGPEDVTVTMDGLARALHDLDRETLKDFSWAHGSPTDHTWLELAAASLAALSADAPPSPSADRPREEER